MARLTKIVIGSFAFRDEGNGCITSKYINNHTEEPFTEACKYLRSSKIPSDIPSEKKATGFEGYYDTVWLEQSPTYIKGELEIRRLPNDAYRLTWWVDNKEVFYGIGTIAGNLLVGAYWE